MAGLNGDWYEALKEEFRKPYYKKLFDTVNEEYRSHKIFPPANDIFNAFHLTPLKDVKVVILGQDPYHNDGQAHGLCFSVQKGVEVPCDTEPWLFDEVGRAGCADAEHRADGARPPGEFPPGNRLGGVYRRGNHGVERPGSPYRVHFMGVSGAAKGEDAEQPEPFDIEGAAPEPAFRLPRLFWQQAV